MLSNWRRCWSITVHSQKCALTHCFSFHLNNLESDSTSRTTICSWFQCLSKSGDTFPDTAVDHLCHMKQNWPLFLHGVNLHRVWASSAGNSYSLCALFNLKNKKKSMRSSLLQFYRDNAHPAWLSSSFWTGARGSSPVALWALLAPEVPEI